MNDPAILSQLRRSAPDKYLACLYLPQSVRGAAAAIYAFEVEIGRIPDLVDEPGPGEIRLQWWREVIHGVREHGGHRLAVELLETIVERGLPRAAFVNHIEARVFDLYQDPMPDRPALEAYCGETASALLQCIALCAGTDPEDGLADAAGHGGVALATCDILGAAARHRTRGRCYFPADMLAAAGLAVGEWLADPPDQRHRTAISALVALAGEHYEKACWAVRNLDASAHAVFLPLATVPARLRAVEKLGVDAAIRTPAINPLHRQWIFWRAAVAGLPKA